MLLSMTGYSRSTGNYAGKTISVEIKTLNSKMTDLKLRFPNEYKEKEIDIRRIIIDHVERGKIDFLIDVQNADGGAAVNLNEALFRGYFRELTRLSQELGIEKGDILQSILRIPNVVMPPIGEVDEQEWKVVENTIMAALDELKKFRRAEGKALAKDLKLRIANILALLEGITPYEHVRMVRMRERLLTNLNENLGSENMDKNRFEQEILYYLEKMDITEEKVRLENHCHYFLEQMERQDQAVGRTLNFISQEIGREINTLGAKAYDADIQKLVVQMKDELEKIKEQLANVL